MSDLKLSPLDLQCIAILREALSATYGVVVATSNAARARTAFYAARNKIRDSELAQLQIRVSPDDSEGELWIIRAQPTVSLAATDLL